MCRGCCRKKVAKDIENNAMFNIVCDREGDLENKFLRRVIGSFINTRSLIVINHLFHSYVLSDGIVYPTVLIRDRQNLEMIGALTSPFFYFCTVKFLIRIHFSRAYTKHSRGRQDMICLSRHTTTKGIMEG